MEYYGYVYDDGVNQLISNINFETILVKGNEYTVQRIFRGSSVYEGNYKGYLIEIKGKYTSGLFHPSSFEGGEKYINGLIKDNKIKRTRRILWEN